MGAGMSGAVLFAVQRSWAYTISAMADPVRQIARTAGATLAAFGALIAALYLTGLESYAPRGFVLAWLASILALQLAMRCVVAFLVRRWTAEGRLIRRAVIVGGGKPAEDLIRQLRRSTSAGIRICGVFDDRTKDRSADPPSATA